MSARSGRRRPVTAAVAAVRGLLVVAVTAVVTVSVAIAATIVVTVAAGVVTPSRSWAAPAAPAAPAGAAATMSDEDAAYCRSVRGAPGIVYYDLVSSSQERVPIGEVHTGPTVFAAPVVGQRVTVTLPGGVSDDGRGWRLAAGAGAAQPVAVPAVAPVLAGGRGAVLLATWNYVVKRVVCVTPDRGTGRIARRDATPRVRYVPVGPAAGPAGGLSFGPAAGAPDRCGSGRPDTGRVRLTPGEASAAVVRPGRSYLAALRLSAIGLPATATTVPGATASFRLWTSSGTAWACGEGATLQASARLFANGR